MKNKSLFLFIIFVFQIAFSEKLLLEFALPLKNSLNPIVTKQYAGLSYINGKIVATLRSGKLFVLKPNGKIILKKQFAGDFLFPAIYHDNSIYLINADKLYKLDKNFKTKWIFTAKSTIVAAPLFINNQIFLHSYDNSVYLIDNSNGHILSLRNHYSSEKIRYIKYNKPFITKENMIVAGFSDGSIIEFKKKSDNSLLPYYKFKTQSSIISNSTKFFDVFSILQIKDTLFFSNGENGGAIFWKTGNIKPKTIKQMKNMTLIKLNKNKILGYGQNGVFIFSGENGKLIKQIANSQTVVSNVKITKKYLIVTDFGMDSYSINSTSGITLFSFPKFQKIIKLVIPSGVSGNIVVLKNYIYILSNRGIFYAFRIFSSEKSNISLQKIKK